MKKILLSFIVLLAAVSVNAQTFDDLQGYYKQSWYSHSFDELNPSFSADNKDLWNISSVKVRVEAVNATTLAFSNMFNWPATIEGVVDLEAKTITFTEQLVNGSYAYLATRTGEDTYEKKYVAHITEDGNIMFDGLSVYYEETKTVENEDGTVDETVETSVEEFEMELIWEKELDNGDTPGGDIVEYMVEKQYIKWAFTMDDGTVVNSADEAIEDLLYSNDRTKDYNYRFKVKDGFNKIKATVTDDGHLLLRNDEGAAMSMSYYVTEADFTRDTYFYDWMTFSTETTGSGVGADNNETSGSLFIKGTYTWSLPDWTTADKGNITLTVSWLVDDDDDNIATTVASTDEAKVYNMLGQRVDKNAKGLLIVNGKKLFVK